MKLGILGGGSWGTALAILWSRSGHQVDLWVRNPHDAERFRRLGRNQKYLPDIPFPAGLAVTDDLARTIAANQILCLAIPLQTYREFLIKIKPMISDAHQLILLSKGIELKTHALPTAIVTDVLGADWNVRTFALSGPSFAREVAEGKPTTVVLAGENVARLRELQEKLNAPTFRMYRNTDVIGVELCGALKNVIAIAGGMVQGMDLGSNSLAGLITRGLSEISRLGVALGARRGTFAGLAGMGDLILTCTGKLSRNLQVGIGLAEGRSLTEILERLGMVAEGVQTCRSAHNLSLNLGIELPITNAVYQILYENLSPKAALAQLMARDLKPELEGQANLGPR